MFLVASVDYDFSFSCVLEGLLPSLGSWVFCNHPGKPSAYAQLRVIDNIAISR